MPEPTLLGDVIQPAWQALTPEQRTCWHYWSLQHPQLNADGKTFAPWGQQSHYARNAQIAVTETNPLLEDPPTTDDAPTLPTIKTNAWPLQARLADDTTARQGFVILDNTTPLPSNAAAIITQGYTEKKTGKGRPPRIRHVTIMQPLSSGTVSLDDPLGYYATTAGDNRYSRVKGLRARRRPDLPLAKIKVINLDNGKITRGVITNPFGGSRRRTNRARATAVNPTNGTNHYP